MTTKMAEANKGPSTVDMPSLLLVLDLIKWFFSRYSDFPPSTKTILEIPIRSA